MNRGLIHFKCLWCEAWLGTPAKSDDVAFCSDDCRGQSHAVNTAVRLWANSETGKHAAKSTAEMLLSDAEASRARSSLDFRAWHRPVTV